MRKTIHAVFGDLDPFGKFWLWLGLGSLVAAAAMSADFGWSVSAKHALFLAILSAVAAFGPMAAEMLWAKRRRGPAIATALICIPLLGIEFYSHAGYTAGLRGQNISEATVQNTKYDGAQTAVTEDKSNLELWKKQLATLMEQHAWAGTVKADGLRAQIVTADKSISLETARGGCKAKCLTEMEKKASIEKQIAIAEQASDLTARIEATQRVLDSKRTDAAKVEHKSSAVEHQNKFLANAVALVHSGSLKPTDFQSQGAEQTVNLAMALAGTGLPAFALFMAGLFRTKTRADDDHANSANSSPFGGALAFAQGQPIHANDSYRQLAMQAAVAGPTTNHFSLTNAALERWAADPRVRQALGA